MIFLGAGASKILGIKTLSDMTNDLVKILREKDHGQVIDEIINCLKNFDITPDFEAIYTVLEGLINPKQAVQNSGAFTAYVCKDLQSITTHVEFRDILRDFRNFIFSSIQY